MGAVTGGDVTMELKLNEAEIKVAFDLWLRQTHSTLMDSGAGGPRFEITNLVLNQYPWTVSITIGPETAPKPEKPDV